MQNQENTPQQVEQVDFNNLQHPPNLDQALISQMDASINSSQWSEAYNVVTMLRSINKFYPQFTPNVMSKYTPDLLKHLAKGKPMIIKNIQKLVKQVFSIGKQINVQQTVQAFLPVLLKKSATDIGQSKQMAQQLLTQFSCNCGYDASFRLTAQSTVDKNIHVAQMALKLLQALVQNIGGSITQLNPNSLKTIMIALSYLIDGKRSDFKTMSLDICLTIYKNIGSENYMNLMNYSLSNQKVQNMGKAMEHHRCQKAKPVSAKERKTFFVKNNKNMNEHNFNNQNSNYQNQNFNMGNQQNFSNQNFNNQNNYIMNQGNGLQQSNYNMSNGFRC